MSSPLDDLPISDISINDQIKRYEHFVDVVLKGDLQRISDQYEKICEQIADYANIKSTIATLKDNDIKSFKSMNDLGSNCYVKCVVPKTNVIYLNIGLNCIVELTLDEAIEFIEKQTKIHNTSLESLVENSSKIKAHIKIILNLIFQLKNESEK